MSNGRRLAGMLTAAALATAATASWAAPGDPATNGEPDAFELLEGAQSQIQIRGCDGALPVLRNLVVRDDFDTLSEENRALAWSWTGYCEILADRLETGEPMLRRSAALTGTPPLTWLLLFDIAGWRGDDEDAVRSLEMLAERHPALTGLLDQARFMDVYARVRFSSPELHGRMLDALDRIEFEPADPLWDPDPLWIDVARRRLTQGRTLESIRALGRLKTGWGLQAAMIDERLAPLLPAARGGNLDLVAEAEAEVARRKRVMEDLPGSLAAVDAAAKALRAVGRPAEALALVDAAVAREAETTASGQPSPFADRRDGLIWLMSTRAFVLADLGRFDEAVQVMAQSASLLEDKEAQTSQLINLAGLLNDLDRPDAALAALRPLLPTIEGGEGRELSEFGRMWVLSEKACAYLHQDRRVEAGPVLEEMARLEPFNPPAHARARICAGDVAGAAAVYVRRIRTSYGRDTAIAALSTFAPEAFPEPTDARFNARLAQVRASPEVQAAVAASGGRLIAVPLQRTWWGTW